MPLLLLYCLALALVAGPARAERPDPHFAAGPTAQASATLLEPARGPFGLPAHNPWTAGLLSLAVNGLGQYYNGDREKGNLMLASELTLPLAWGLDYLTGKSYVTYMSYAVILGVKVWSVSEAFQSAAPPSASALTPH